ncbi:MAG: LysR family transcriptional regulator [Candidatus Sericytochromatia bacterium]|nr:LysR family transcriptional regulator [Candidatus Sericytochromatia bacterium]
MDKKINLEWYRTFKEIYQCQIITEASNKLGLTQSAVSLQPSNFEKVLNKKLFDRNQRKMIPTEYAKIFYYQVVDLIEKLDNIQTLTLENNSKVINVGCPHDFFDSFLIDKISHFDFRINIYFRLQIKA